MADVTVVSNVCPSVFSRHCNLSRHRFSNTLSREFGALGADSMLTRWQAFTCFLDDGRICFSNNAAERALRGLALGRKLWLLAGSERGAERAAVIYTLIHTAKLKAVDLQAWLADALAWIADHPLNRVAAMA